MLDKALFRSMIWIVRYQMKASIAIGLLLLIMHSAFPPRVDPKWPDSKVSRAFILSPYFYFSHYTKTPIGDPSNETFSISKSPAEFDWGRYVAEMVIVISITGLGCLLQSRRQASALSDSDHLENQSEQAADGNPH